MASSTANNHRRSCYNVSNSSWAGVAYSYSSEQHNAAAVGIDLGAQQHCVEEKLVVPSCYLLEDSDTRAVQQQAAAMQGAAVCLSVCSTTVTPGPQLQTIVKVIQQSSWKRHFITKSASTAHANTSSGCTAHSYQHTVPLWGFGL